MRSSPRNTNKKSKLLPAHFGFYPDKKIFGRIFCSSMRRKAAH
jgi:hypothetical protein